MNNKTAIERTVAGFRWNMNSTNHSKEYLPLTKADLAFRQNHLVERGFTHLGKTH
jgi:hypothetical protein